MKKIGIISSKGGHLLEILRLTPLLRKERCFWVTFPGEDVKEYLKKEKKYFAYYPESRNTLNLFKNLYKAISIFKLEKPDILISCGAGIAVPFFLVGKFLFGAKLIYIESYDFIVYPSLTGKLVYNFVDLFIVQHKKQLSWYKKAKYWGSLL